MGIAFFAVFSDFDFFCFSGARIVFVSVKCKISRCPVCSAVFYTNYDIFSKFAGYNSHYNIIKQKQISQLVKEFISDDMFSKRETIINLLTKSSNYENQKIIYLLRLMALLLLQS